MTNSSVIGDITNHSCVCSTPDSMINTQIDLYLFYKEKSVMTLISISHHCAPTPYPCIYDAYMVVRRTCNYRDSTLSKNHPIILLTHPSHSSSHSHLHLSHLSPTLMVITPSPITYLHSSILSHTLSSLSHTQRQGLASLFITPKSYLNTHKRELGHLCPSGILRSISLSPTTCLSTWRYHYLSIITSLLVQVGPITLKCLFNAIGTIINPHLELTRSSSHQDPLACNMCIKIGLPICAYTLYTGVNISPGVNITPYPCVVAPVTYTHQTAIHIHLPTLSAAKLAMRSSPCTLSPSGPTGWRPMLDHLHISPGVNIINAIHMTISSTINLIGSVTPRPMLDHPHITHPHHTYKYYTHTHSNTLITL